ncbi:hypothetical protein BH11ARM1_BH11ARM1_10150 [soil metagenome]
MIAVLPGNNQNMVLALALAALTFNLSPTIRPDAPIVVPGGPGHYDFMNVCPSKGLAFACHPAKSSFTVIDMTTSKAWDVDAGTECNGITADPATGDVFAAGPGNDLVRFDSKMWKKTGTLALDGPADCLQFDSKRGVLYVDNDDGTHLWIVDPKAMKVTGSAEIHEAPEYMEYDQGRDRIFQAIKSTSTVQVIDPEAKKVVAEWKLGDLTGPHGLSIDRAMGKVFVVGKNGKLVVLDAATGTITGTLDVTKGSDQIAYDEQLKQLYIPGGGQIQVIDVSSPQPKLVTSVPVNADCHRIVVEPKSHDLWVAFSDKTESQVQRFKVSK